MSARKPIPTSRAQVAKGAMAVAITLLQDERVREQLRKAPAAARTWAERRRATTTGASGGGGSDGGGGEPPDPETPADDVHGPETAGSPTGSPDGGHRTSSAVPTSPTTAGTTTGTADSAVAGADLDRLRERLDPTRRFGQRGIERRLAALRRNVELAFPDPASPDATTIIRAVDELDRAAAVSATMPRRERRRAHSRITAEVGRLETALVDAVLPP